MRTLLALGIFLLVLAPHVFAQSALGPNQVFIQNADSVAKNNDLVTVPLGFASGQMSALGLASLQLKDAGGNSANDLVTQAVPTSYYSNGSVRTAVAYVLYSSPPNPAPERIYNVGAYSGSQPGFQMDSRVDDLLHNRNGSSLKVKVVDIKGQTYETILDLDGMGNCNAQNVIPAKFANNCVKQLTSGPVVQQWEIHKRTDKVGSADMPYLFSSVFFITAVSGKDYVLVDHILSNSNNLDEDPAPAASGGPITNGANYGANGKLQTGVVFYTNASIEITTPGSADHQTYLLDAPYIQPSMIDPVLTTATHTVYWIMPTNGQAILSAAPYNDGVTNIPNPSNYIGGGQGLVSRLAISFSGLTKHPLEENGVKSGAPLSMFSQIKDSFFREVPDPSKIVPNVSYVTDAANVLSFFRGEAQNPAKGHRFGQYDIVQGKDLGSTGYPDVYHQEHYADVRYLLSCDTRCERSYMDALRYHEYARAQATNLFTGFREEDHPNVNINFYRGTAYEGESCIQTDTQGACIAWDTKCQNSSAVYGSKDLLGFCATGYPPAGHRVDAAGRTVGDYSADPSTRTLFHDWTMSEPAHLSMAMEYYRYLFTGDLVGKYLTIMSTETAESPFYYSQTHPTSGQGGVSDRGRGRGLIWMSHLYNLTLDPFYKTFVGAILDLTDALRNKSADGTRGTNPATGDYYPVKYYANASQGFSQSSCPGQVYTTIKPFQNSQLAHGVAVYYRDVLDPSNSGDATRISQVKAMSTDNLHYTYTYEYKTPAQVRNKTPNLSDPTKQINEGGGGFSDYYCMYTGDTGGTGPFDTYNKYLQNQQEEMYPGLCNELAMASEIRKTDPTYLKNGTQDLLAEYYAKFKEAYDRVWIHNPYKNKFISKNTWGVDMTSVEDETLCGLTYAMGVPNAAGGAYINGTYQASGAPACPDSDGDGWTTCGGDCADNDPSVHPGQGENCTNSKDDNCNLMTDCNDPWCSEPIYPTGNGSGNTACQNASTHAYCGNQTLDAGEQCDSLPNGAATPNGAGTAINGCGPLPNNSPPISAASAGTGGYCIPAFTAFASSCQCAGGGLFITSITSTPFPIVAGGSTNYTLQVSGSGVSSGDTLRITKQGSPSTVVNLILSSSLGVTLTPANISTLGVGTHSVNVIPASGGGNSNTLPLTIYASNTFTLATITPSTALIGQASPVLTLSGALFQNGDQVEFTGASGTTLPLKTPTIVDALTLTTSLTANDTTTLALGNGTVRVKCGAGHSCASPYTNTIPFAITSPTLPSISTLSVTDSGYNSTTAWILVTGTNLNAGGTPTVKVGTFTVPAGQVRNIAAGGTSLEFQLLAANTVTLGVGTFPVTVTVNGNTSNGVNFTIHPPVLVNLLPTSIPTNAPATLALEFLYPGQNPQIMIGTTTYAYTTIDYPSKTMTLDLSTNQINTLGVGNFPVRILNSGLQSAPITLTITTGGPPGPTLTTLAPSSVEYNQNTPTLGLTGTNFTSGGVVKVDALTIPSGQVSFVSATQMSFTLTATQTQTLGVGNHNVTVTVGTQTSNAKILTITDPIPTLTSVISSPSPATMLTTQTLTLTGTKFQSYSTIRLTNGAQALVLVPTSITGTTSMTVDLSRTQTKTLLGSGTAPFTATVNVVNASQTSNGTGLLIAEATPSLNQVDNGGGSNQVMENTSYTIKLKGSQIESYAKVKLGNLPDITPTLVNAANAIAQFTLTGTMMTQLGGAGSSGSTSYPVYLKNGNLTSNGDTIVVMAQTGGTLPPGPFTMAATPGSTAGEIQVNYTSAGGTDPIQYTLKAIPRSDPLLLDGVIDDVEFESSANWVVTLNDPTLPYSFIGTPGTIYCFVARATNAAGTSYSSTDCATAANGTSGPGAFSMSASGTTPGQLTLTWSDAGGSPTPGYTLKGILKSDPLASDETLNISEFLGSANWAVNTVTVSPYSFNGTPDTRYCFAVLAQNGTGNVLSNTVCTTTPASPTPPSGNNSNSGNGGGNGSNGQGSGNAGGGEGNSGNNGSVNSPACTPAIELCDGVDNDCDGQTDEGCAYVIPATCSNGVLDAGETYVDCGGTCPGFCAEEIPNSLFAFALSLASPILILVQLVVRLLGIPQ